jgi:hypothetical protein
MDSRLRIESVHLLASTRASLVGVPRGRRNGAVELLCLQGYMKSVLLRLITCDRHG